MNNIFENNKVALYINFDTIEEYKSKEKDIKKSMSEFCNINSINEYKEYIDIGFIGKNRKRSRYDTLLRHIDNKVIDAVVVYNLSHLGRHPRRLGKVINTLYNKKAVVYSLEEQRGLINFNKEELESFNKFTNEYIINIIKNNQSKLQKDIYNQKHNTKFDINSYIIKEYRKSEQEAKKINRSVENEL